MPQPDFWKFLPAVTSVGLALFGWGFSVESRLNDISTTQKERGPTIAKLVAEIEELSLLAHDPSTKPQTKEQLEQISGDHDRLSNRMDRLEERFNNFHTFLLQMKPAYVPPSKRGALPFRLDEGVEQVERRG